MLAAVQYHVPCRSESKKSRVDEEELSRRALEDLEEDPDALPETDAERSHRLKT